MCLTFFSGGCMGEAISWLLDHVTLIKLHHLLSKHWATWWYPCFILTPLCSRVMAKILKKLKIYSLPLEHCTYVRTWPHTVNVFFQYCVFSKFGFQIQLASQAQDCESLPRDTAPTQNGWADARRRLYRNKIASGSASVGRLSRRRLGKLDTNKIVNGSTSLGRLSSQCRQARQEQDRECQRLRWTTEQTDQARHSELNQTSLPSLEQEWVRSKLAGFRAKLAKMSPSQHQAHYRSPSI